VKVCQQEGASRRLGREKLGKIPAKRCVVNASKPEKGSWAGDRMPEPNAKCQCHAAVAVPAFPCMGHGPWGDVLQGTHLSALYVFLNTVFCTNNSEIKGWRGLGDLRHRAATPPPKALDRRVDDRQHFSELHDSTVDRAISKRHQIASRRVGPSPSQARLERSTV
jgi:hypothetical protein